MWTDNWLTSGYTFTGDDFDSLQKALLERVTACSQLTTFNALTYNLRYPDGLNPLTPPKTPVDYQDAAIYIGMQLAIVALLNTGGTPAQTGFFPPASNATPAVVRKGVTLAGTTITYRAGSTLPLGWLAVGGDSVPPVEPVIVYRHVGEMRTDAGLTDYSGLSEYNSGFGEAFRRRTPRTVLDPVTDPAHPYTSDPSDLEGNTCPNGASAWERKTVPAAPSGFLDSGRLLKYDSTAKIWKYTGQGKGEMPDLLDTDSAAPNHAVMGRHKTWDYIDEHGLNELKQLIKLIEVFTYLMPIEFGTGIGAFGEDFGGTSYPTVEANALAAYNASAASPTSSAGQAGQFAYSKNNSNTYAVELGTGQNQYSGTLDDTLARNIDVYVAADVPSDGGDPSVTPSFDGEATGLSRMQALKVETLVNPVASFVSSEFPASVLPAPNFPGGGAPPLDTGYVSGWTLVSAWWVADLSGVFTYT